MSPFDVFQCHPPGWPEPHPCVVVSHPDRAARKDPVCVVMCSSKRATREPDARNEVILDKADGLDWPTICKCDVIYAVPRSELKNHRGSVTPIRRQQLVRTIIASNGWVEVLAG